MLQSAWVYNIAKQPTIVWVFLPGFIIVYLLYNVFVYISCIPHQTNQDRYSSGSGMSQSCLVSRTDCSAMEPGSLESVCGSTDPDPDPTTPSTMEKVVRLGQRYRDVCRQRLSRLQAPRLSRLRAVPDFCRHCMHRLLMQQQQQRAQGCSEYINKAQCICFQRIYIVF